MNKSVDVPKEQEQMNTQDLVVVNIQEETHKEIVVQEVQNIENPIDSTSKEENSSVSVTTKSGDNSI